MANRAAHIAGRYTVAAAVLGVVTAALLTHANDIARVFRNGSRSISGTWVGRLEPVSYGSSRSPSYDVHAEFSQDAEELTAAVASTSIAPAGQNLGEIATGTLEDGDHVVLAFRSADARIADYGVAMLRLDPAGRTLTGDVLANRLDGPGTIPMKLTLRRQ